MDHLRIKASRRYGTLSPLRYPGGKSALAGLFADIIAGLEIKNPRYVEPYAGGAGAGIALLREGIVKHLVINDIDPAVFAFWNSVVTHNKKFVELVSTTPLTVDEWKRQRSIYRASDTSDLLGLGFSFFYLNRTNRSGVLNAGVIGGQDQKGNYKIDARFNRETLKSRLEAIGNLAEKITVTDLDGRTVIQRYSSDASTFMYIDPPYVQAGSQLYLNAFDGRDHNALAEIVKATGKAHWLLTYDTAPVIEKLYGDCFQCRLEISYSARHPGRAEELLISSESVARILKATQNPINSMVAGGV
ncbi:DNA adenine methylase [Glycomyces buryatensis]|uniref:site-specific DNA-methyltransferase (adenine-specific) n=1 Tax=Glycomyces buryatensis TaxID=2570927 RepID=A0A4S8QBX7_9ACTN|nr:DNA adenine methylase [Glycomyces buryatensis]THV42017.1 DNA adenine methylase [Glycomyces buryatensis]